MPTARSWCCPRNRPRVAALAEHGFPFVVVDPRTEVPDGIPVVCAAHSSGATQATRHLLNLGHRRIGVIAGPRGWVATQERLRGYHAALAGAGVLPDQSLVRYSNFRVDGGREQAAALLDPAGTADRGLRVQRRHGHRGLQEAAARGLKVARRLLGRRLRRHRGGVLTVPALTTVRQPLAELGRTAVSVLLRQLGNRRLEPLRIELETRLVPRDSTRPRGSADRSIDRTCPAVTFFPEMFR